VEDNETFIAFVTVTFHKRQKYMI